jgi:hypothetical protein
MGPERLTARRVSNQPMVTVIKAQKQCGGAKSAAAKSRHQ